MNVNVNVKRRIIVNGKEYNSVEEMPADLRRAFEKAMAERRDSGNPAGDTTVRTKIIFNGQEYKNMEMMPPDERKLYETVLKAANAGSGPAGRVKVGDITGKPAEDTTYGTNGTGNPSKIEPAGSLRRAAIAIVLLIVVVALLYFVFQSK